MQAELVQLLGEVGTYKVNFHDYNIIAIDATLAEAQEIKKESSIALDETGLVVSIETANYCGAPGFEGGANKSNSLQVRTFAMQNTLNTINMGVY